MLTAIPISELRRVRWEVFKPICPPVSKVFLFSKRQGAMESLKSANDCDF